MITEGGVTLVMVITEVVDIGVSTITKAALTKGLSQFILTVYSGAIGVFVLLLSSFIFFRNRTLTPLTFPVLCKLFLLGLVCCCQSLSSATGIGFGSPTLSSAMSDLTPAFAFLLAIISRMEKVDLRIKSSQAKSIGTFVSIAGALIVTLYKGQKITNQNSFLLSVNPNWVVGGTFSAGSSILLALLFIIQAWIAKDYPEEQMITLITYTFVTIFSATVSLFVEKDPNAWTVKPDTRLIAIVSSFIFVSATTLGKAALNQGMSQFVYIVYSNLLSMFILILCNFISYRNRPRTPITAPILSKIFLASIIGCIQQIFMIIGIKYSSPTLSSAMNDLTPAFTFLIATLTRMEQLDLRLRSSQAKTIGTLVSIGGALIVTLYQGQPINLIPGIDNLHRDLLGLSLLSPNWILGAIFTAAASLCFSVFYVIQVWILRDYPEEVMLSLIGTIFSTVLCTVVALIAETDPNAWKIKSSIESIAVVFAAVFPLACMSIVHAWACRKKGAVYVVAFKPLDILIAILLGVSFLGDALYLGSVIGAIVLVSGFYCVLWGKSQEEKLEDETRISRIEPCSTEKMPLLQDKKNDQV